MTPNQLNQLARKEATIIAALDEFAPVMQTGIDQCNQICAIKLAVIALQDYPDTYKIRRFAFITSVPDYCAAAAENLLKLAAVQTAPNMSLYIIGELLGIALEYIQKAKTSL